MTNLDKQRDEFLKSFDNSGHELCAGLGFDYAASILSERIEKLEAALKFYALRDNYAGFFDDNVMLEDNGKTARQALRSGEHE